MKTIKPIAVHVDRLVSALAEQGIDIKRTKALELVAAALGYHNTHECTAASRRGDLTPPAAQPVCRIEIPGGQALIVLRDPVSDAPYAIDETFLEQVVEDERRETYGPSPYGRLLDLGAVGDHQATTWGSTVDAPVTSDEGTLRILVELERDGEVTEETVRSNVHQAIHAWRGGAGLSADDDEGMIGGIMTRVLNAGDVGMQVPSDQLLDMLRATGRTKIHLALIHHRHGIDVRIGTTLASVSRQVADYARENWGDAWESDRFAERTERVGLPEEYEGLDDDEIERMYFAAMSLYGATEYVDYSVMELDSPKGGSHADDVAAAIAVANSNPPPAADPFPGVPASLYTVNASRDGHVFVETFTLEDGQNEEDRGRELAATAFGLDLDDYREPVDPTDDDDDDDLTDEEKEEAAQEAEDIAKDERNQNFDADIDSIEIERASFDDMLLPILQTSWAAAQKLPAGDPLRDVIRRQVMDAMPKPGKN